MKIAYITNVPANDYSGWSGSYKAIYDSLNKITKTENIVIRRSIIHKICVITIKYLTFGKINHSKIDTYFINREVKKVKNILNGYDVLFFPAQSEILASKSVDLDKEIIYLSDATYDLMNGYYFPRRNSIESRTREYEEQESIKKADKIIYASKWAAENAVTHYGVSTNKTSVIPFGAILPDIYNASEKNKKEKINLLLVGSDWKRKGVDLAIETVERLNNIYKEKKFNLTIVGLTAEESPSSRKWPSYIRFEGKLNKNIPEELKKMVKIYSNSDIFILPTKAECAGIIFCEASMYGLPSITYKTGGTSSYIFDKKNGFLLPEGSGSKSFVRVVKDIIDKGELDELSTSSRKIYEERLNWMIWRKKVRRVLFNKN